MRFPISTFPFLVLLVAATACRSTVTPDASPPSEKSATAGEAIAKEREPAAPKPPAVPDSVDPARIPATPPDVAAALQGPDAASLARADLLRALYEEQTGKLFLVDPSAGPTAAGRAVIAAVDAADAHALDPERYHASEIAKQQEALASEIQKMAQLGPIPLDAGEVEALRRIAEAERAATGVDPDGSRLLTEALAKGATGPLPRATQALAARKNGLAAVAALAARLEVTLADAMLAYAHDMRLFSNRKLPEAEVDKRGAEALVRERLESFFRGAALEPTHVGDMLSFLPPAGAQYPRLVKAYAHYRELCAKGPWPTVDYTGRKPLKAGATGEVIDDLRERLAAEGFYSGALTPGAPLDEALAQAINAYKATHQMDEDGALDKGMAGSLNIPCERRLAQIGLTMQRWRESRIVDPNGYFVFINIPDFHGEVWDKSELLHRFRIVVGNRTRGWDPKQRKTVFKNATPRLAAHIEYLEFNPYWNVPDRIREEELQPEMEKDPDYLSKHGYELHEEGGREWIRQRPGRGNALGRVKFLFPNPHDVYLHDTNQRDLFKRATRAYSHGCMRVHEPLELAELLLSREGKWDPGIVESRRFTPVNFDNPIPIYIEYYVVRVDDEGGVHFNLDVYGLDARRLDPS